MARRDDIGGVDDEDRAGGDEASEGFLRDGTAPFRGPCCYRDGQR